MNRSLPAEIPVAGRNEAQSAAELVQGRLRQAFNHGLAVIALSAFAHDEQMTRWPESVFERLTPDHFDRVGLHSIPCRDVAACNIRTTGEKMPAKSLDSFPVLSHMTVYGRGSFIALAASAFMAASESV